MYLPKMSWAMMYFTYFIGPLMLLYLKVLKGSYTVSFRSLYHAIPYFANVLIIMVTVMTMRAYFSQVIFFLNKAQIIHLLIYAGLIGYQAKLIPRIKWVQYIAVAYLGYCLCFLSYHVMVWTGVLALQYDYMVSLGMMVFIYFVGYYSFVNLHVPRAKNKKYQKSSLTPQASLRIYQLLAEHLDANRPYLDSGLNLQMLTSQMNLTTHVLSQVINEHYEKSFSELMNSLRIEYAMLLMQKDEYLEEKIISIAYDAGFNNKVSFINAFKKVNGTTPTAYRKQLPPRGKMNIAS
jgi:AraC-like DNA-binding protein